jgi:hypothetical protein
MGAAEVPKEPKIPNFCDAAIFKCLKSSLLQTAQSCRLLHGRALQCSFTKPAIQALRSISGGQSSAEQDGHMVSALGPSWINITARMITHTLADRRWSWHVQF